MQSEQIWDYGKKPHVPNHVIFVEYAQYTSNCRYLVFQLFTIDPTFNKVKNLLVSLFHLTLPRGIVYKKLIDIMPSFST